MAAEQINSKMKLTSITVEPVGTVTFWHNDGVLFFGHSILVFIDSKNTVPAPTWPDSWLTIACIGHRRRRFLTVEVQ